MFRLLISVFQHPSKEKMDLVSSKISVALRVIRLLKSCNNFLIEDKVQISLVSVSLKKKCILATLHFQKLQSLTFITNILLQTKQNYSGVSTLKEKLKISIPILSKISLPTCCNYNQTKDCLLLTLLVTHGCRSPLQLLKKL